MPKLSCKGPCLTPHISAVNRVIPDILQRSIVHGHAYKVTKNRWSRAENAPSTEGQTCGIARKQPKLSCKGPCLTPHISAVNRDIPDILQRSLAHRHIYKVTENRWSRAENAPTTEGQNWYTFRNLCDFGQLWRAIVRSLIQIGGRVIPRWNRLAKLKKTPLTERV